MKRDKKEKRKEIIDCYEEEENEEITEAALKVSYRRCKKKKKSRTRSVKQPTRQISMIDTLLNRIQPSLEERDQFLNPRHIACLLDDSSKIDFESSEETGATSSPDSLRRERQQNIHQRKLKEKELNKSIKKTKCADEVEGKTKEVSKHDVKITDVKGAAKMKNNRTRKESRRKNIKTKEVQESELIEMDECESICSFDSEICLAGMKLTPEDKKKIEEYQRQTEPPGNQEKR